MSYDLRTFVAALQHTLQALAQDETHAGEIEEGSGSRIFADVSAHLAIRNGGHGCVVITFSEAAACRLVQQVTGREVTFDDALVADSVGEVLNMVVGHAQRKSPHRFSFALPVIAKGRAHEVKVLSGGYAERVVTEMAGHEVGLYLVMEPAPPP